MRAASWLPTHPGPASLRRILTPPGRGWTGLRPVLLAAFITAPGTNAGGWWPRRKAAAPPAPEVDFPFTAEDCVAAADRAIAEERWPKAAEWLTRAHRLAPTSGRVCADLAFARRQMGDYEGALRMYEQAARCGVADGEPHFHAALTCLEAGRSVDEAESRILRAFEVDPELAFVIDGEAFEPLRGRPGFEAALRKARRTASGGTAA